MLDAQTQTQLTGNRIKDVLKELGSLRQSKCSRTYLKKKAASKRMGDKLIVGQIGKRMVNHIVGGNTCGQIGKAKHVVDQIGKRVKDQIGKRMMIERERITIDVNNHLQQERPCGMMSGSMELCR